MGLRSRSVAVGQSHMVLLDNLPKQLKATDPEDKRIISGVSWEQYDAFLSQLGDSPWYRVTYIDGLCY